MQLCIGPSVNVKSCSDLGKGMIQLCWPMCALTLVIFFSFGCCLGRLWQRSCSVYKRKGGQEIEIEVASGISKKGLRHREFNLAAKEVTQCMIREVYLSKVGTKVHFIKGCHGLKAADYSKIKTIAVCQYCLDNERRNMKFGCEKKNMKCDREKEEHEI